MRPYAKGDLVIASSPMGAVGKLFRVVVHDWTPDGCLCEEVGGDGSAWFLRESDMQRSLPLFNPGVIPSGASTPIIATAHKYSPGQKVVHKTSGQKADIRGQSGFNHLGIPLYRIEYDNYWFGSDVASEADLNLIEPVERRWGAKCECGSDSTYGDTGFHSHWCPKFSGDPK